MQTKQNRAWFTGAHIKWLAVITMFIDHMGAAFLEPVILQGQQITWLSNMGISVSQWVQIYMILRGIGRFAFPAFCFLLVEGFYHTGDRRRYLRNLLIFSLVSEVPFDLALFGKVINWENQNVFWTLSAGFVAVWISELCMRKAMKDKDNGMPYYIAIVAVVGGMALLAQLCEFDYGAVGVAAIFIMYAVHNNPVLGALFAWMMLAMLNELELFAFPFILSVMFYNGKRGKQNKYFFYIFYPAHLLLLALFKIILF